MYACVCFLLTILIVNGNANFQLSVFHFNDFHARFEETDDWGAPCKDSKCIGGFSRAHHLMQELLDENPGGILLNAGDNFQGTLWYTLYKWNVTQYFLNKLPWDATTLGNHEFDDGISGVVPFLEHLKSPVVVANIDDSSEPDIQGLYKKSVVIEKNGKKIGIIGVIISTVDELANTGKLKFFGESESVNAEAERLENEENVDTIIVLSHCGYDIDQKIAGNATSKIGLIVGAHSHTFLYSGDNPPGPDTPAGPYPTVVERPDGKKVLVVQASAYSKYVGNITVSYNSDGDVTDWSGNPLFLGTDSPKDATIDQELQPWKDTLDDIGNEILGSSLVQLNADGCYYSECLLGNFIADVMVYSAIEYADENSWTNASVAITNAGGLRSTISQGNITLNDLLVAQPFENTFDIGDLQGVYLKELFEETTKSYNNGRISSSIALLQVSGVQIRYNLSKPVGQRVESLKIRCNECLKPIYEDLVPEKYYRIVMPSFLKTGGDGLNVLPEKLENIQIGRKDVDVLREYLNKYSPVYAEINGRITVIGDEDILFHS